MTTIAQEVPPVVIFDIDALPTDWEALASAGRDALTHMDSGRFLVGDIANTVTRTYGKQSLKKFAGDIGIDRANTLYTYAQVAAGYEFSTRIKYQELGLRFTHFRLALRAGERAQEFLDAAVDNGWPVAELSRQIAAAIGKPVPPRLLWSGECIVIDQAFGCLNLRTEADLDVGAGQRVTVKVYEAEAQS